MTAIDLDAFEELFRNLHAPLCEVVDSYVRSQAVAEELVQDLFFAVWMRRKELNVISLRGYLFTAARNRALHHLRRQSIARRLAELIQRAPPPPPLQPDVETQRNDETARVRRAVDALPPRTRLALVLQTDHAMSHGEIAEAMGISLKGVEKLLSTARAKLRVSLDSIRPENSR